jgi:hypothetical protein
MEPLGLKIKKALSRLKQTDNYLFRKPEREWDYDDLSLVKSFLRTARVEEDYTMEDLNKIQEFFSKPLEEMMSLDDQAKAYYLEKFKKGEISSLPEDPKAAFLDQMMKDEMEKDATQYRRETGLEEVSAEYPRRNKRPIKVGDIVGNTVQGFDFKVLDIQDDKMKVKNTITGKESITDIDNMRLSSTDNSVKEGGKWGYQEAAKNMIKFLQNQLDDMGVEYEMDPKSLSKPFIAIYKPENQSEELNAKFENFIEKANLGSVVKTSMKEATKDEETEFHKKLDTLVHKTFGKRKGEMEEAKLTEAFVPRNIAEFAERKGVSRLVKTVAGWAEKVGKRIVGGTAIGKNYDTLILDMTFQGSEIRINTEYETVELYDEPVRTFHQFKRVYEENQEENLEEGINDFSPITYAKKVLNGEMSIEDAMEETGLRYVTLADLIKKLKLNPALEEAITDPRIGNPKFGPAPKEFASLRAKLGDDSLLDKIQMINVNVLRDLLDELDSYNLEENKDSTYNEYSEIGYKKVGEAKGGELDERYFLEVSVRDASKALDIFRDQYSDFPIKLYGSNVYASNNLDGIYDFYYDLMSQDIEILDSSDFDEDDFEDEDENLFEVQKGFGDRISPETFAKLKDQVVNYSGNKYKVTDSDEFTITIEDEDGETKTINLNQFIQKGLIPELKKKLQETIQLGEEMIYEELCPAGKAYIKRRKAAGEKSSAYLSGRAVKVCKGQMSGRSKKKK